MKQDRLGLQALQEGPDQLERMDLQDHKARPGGQAKQDPPVPQESVGQLAGRAKRDPVE